MGKIALNHGHVTDRLSEARQAVNALRLNGGSGTGSSSLAITGNWSDVEAMTRELLSMYIEGVQVTIDDTRANVDLLKRQDEVIR